MIGFDNVNWNDYYLTDFFRIQKGNQNNMSSLQDGLVPLVSAKKCDNGYKQFIAPNNKELFSGNIITLNNDGDGGAGIAYYQPFEMALDTHCTALIPKIEMSRYHMLFISLCITKQRSRFGHGHSINNSRLRTFKFMLPATAEGTPDWQFMEAYMKQQEQAILKPTIERLCKRLITNELMGGGKLSNLTWKEFIIEDLFHAKRPLARKEDEYSEGDVQFVASGCVNNGVTKFCAPKSDEVLDKGNCLTVSPVDGSCYYQATDFLGRGGAGSSIIILYAKNFELNRFNALFISQAITKTASAKYSYGHMASLDRIKRDKIILPANKDGQPDFAFMSSFMQQIEKDILGTTLRYFADKQQITPPHANNEINWQHFYIRDIFALLEAGKSKGLNHLKKDKRGISYLGATNLNNAVLDFVQPVSNMIQKGNCIAFIRNGEGSMGYSVYKEEDFIATSDITVGYNKNLNKYNAMFITTVADRIRGKYNFGYKRSAQRLAKEILTLPVTPEGTPDWQYMESYMRHIESQQIVKYLQHYTKHIAD